ncbi:hypothetical protein [Nonomuraea sp. JJY05]|uniref:hypothetical protein n=1 Tax=Nonomuraea sp. JJY05 TaxID=3350255 RepID=UPI00373E7DAE
MAATIHALLVDAAVPITFPQSRKMRSMSGPGVVSLWSLMVLALAWLAHLAGLPPVRLHDLRHGASSLTLAAALLFGEEDQARMDHGDRHAAQRFQVAAAVTDQAQYG